MVVNTRFDCFGSTPGLQFRWRLGSALSHPYSPLNGRPLSQVHPGCGGSFGGPNSKQKLDGAEETWTILATEGTPVTGPLEELSRWSKIRGYLLNDLPLSYHVPGPTKVRFDIGRTVEKFLGETRMIPDRDEKWARAIAQLNMLHATYVRDGIAHPETHVEIDDWRIRFFPGRMERFASIETEGAVRALGPAPNIVRYSRGCDVYYEWATGRLHISSTADGTDQGYFSVRFSTRYTPPFFRFAPWIALLGLTVGMLSLTLRYCDAAKPCSAPDVRSGSSRHSGEKSGSFLQNDPYVLTLRTLARILRTTRLSHLRDKTPRVGLGR